MMCFLQYIKVYRQQRKACPASSCCVSLGKYGMLHSLGVPPLPHFVILRILLQKDIFLSTFPSLL